jgi:hypothetical protein
MAILPTLQNIAGKIGEASQTVQDTLAIVDKTIQSSRNTITAITKGKSPTPSAEPATVSELVPRNVGGLTVKPGDIGQIMLIVGVVAGLIIIANVRKR